MSWIREMEQDAVAVSIPNWEWRDDDVVLIDTYWEEGWHSDDSWWDPTFQLIIVVERADKSAQASCTCTNKDATEFWEELMKRGSQQ
jgi:hypothetical protein